MNVTVVICTWNRAASLARTLEILCAVRVPAGLEWECVVVNNNSSDHTDEVLASFCHRLPLRRLFEPMPGLSHARNHAAREAGGDLVLWTDDDIRIDREWMAAYVDAARRWPEASYFGGIIKPLFPLEPPPFVSAHRKIFQGLLGSRDFGPVERPFPEQEGPYGGNMAVRRAVLENWSFDPRLGHHHAERITGEETAFFNQLRRHGHQGVWVPSAKVLHVIPPEQLSPAGLRRHFYAYGRSLVRQGDSHRTRILSFPRCLCRGCCLLTRPLIMLSLRVGRTNWVPLLARCATWEGILDEAGASAPAPRVADVVDD